MASKSRIVVVSSGAVRSVPDVSALDKDVLGGSGTNGRVIYAETKFIQLLGAHWWRRQLTGQCDVVAVSPGLIPSTGIDRNKDLTLPTNSPDAKTIPEGTLSSTPSINRLELLTPITQALKASSLPLRGPTSPRTPNASSSPAGVSGGPRTYMGSLWTRNCRTSGVQPRKRLKRRKILSRRRKKKGKSICGCRLENSNPIHWTCHAANYLYECVSCQSRQLERAEMC